MSIAASSRKKQASSKKEFTGSLLRNTIFWLLLLTLTPLLGIGAATYFRMNTIVREQYSAQMQVLVSSYTRDLSNFATTRSKGIAKLAQDEEFVSAITKIIDPSLSEIDKTSSKVKMLHVFTDFMAASPETIFDELSIIDKNGTVLISNNSVRNRKNYSDSPVLMGLLGVDQVQVLYRPEPLFKGEFIWTATHVYIHPGTGEKYTLLGALSSPITANILAQITKQFSGAAAILTLPGNHAFSLDGAGAIAKLQLNKVQQQYLHKLATSPQSTDAVEYAGVNNVPVLGYGNYIPELRATLMLEIPQGIVYSQLNSMLSFNIILLLIVMLVITLLISIGVRRMIIPLTALAGVVREFSQGQWTQRAKVNRKDEIGMLSNAFNLMADQLSNTYQILESKVDERSRHLQTAAEIARVVSTSSSREDILKQTVHLILDQFHCADAAIYLLDSSLSHFSMVETGGRLSPEQTRHLLNQRIRSYSPFGQVIASNEMKIYTHTAQDEIERPETMLSGQNAEVIIPISTGSQIIGLLDAQSPAHDFFDDGLISVLTMLADQVANGIQTISLIESTQVDLRETSLVYRASRQITQANTPAEILQTLIGVIEKTPYTGLLMEERGDEMVVTTIASANSSSVPPQKIAVSLTRVRQFLEQRSYVLVENIAFPSDLFAAFTLLIQHNCISAAVIPIQTGENLKHILILGSSSETALTATSIQPYLNLAEMIANTQERLSVQSALEHNVSNLKTLANISQAISGETHLENVYRRLHEQLALAFNGDLDLVVALFDEKNSRIEIPYMTEQGELLHVDPFPLGEGLTSHLIKHRKPLLISENLLQQGQALGIKIIGQPPKSWAGVPLMIANEVVGALIAEDVVVEGRFGEADIELLNTISPQVAITVRNAQLVTAMETALKAYDQERFLLNTLLNNIPDRVYFKDRNGKYIRASASVGSQYNLPAPDALIGKSETELDSDETAAEIQAVEDEIMLNNVPQTGSVEKLVDDEGAVFWSLVSRLPMIDSAGEVTGLLGIHRDITELKQAEEIAQKRARQVRTAAEIARDTSGMLNLEELLEKSVNLVRDRFGFYHASIFLLDASGEYAVLRESTGEAGMQLKSAGHRLAVGSQSIVGQVVSRGDALVVNDVTREANYYPNPLLPMTHSELAIPLKAGDTITGAIDVQSIDVDAFGTEDINILTILADQLAGAIINADLYAQTQASVAKHRFLHQITTAAAGCTNLEDALATTVQGLTTAMGTDRVAIYLFNPQGALEIRASSGFTDEDLSGLRIASGSSAVGLAALGRRAILVKNALTDTRYFQTDERVRSLLAVPILYNDVAQGVLTMESMQIAAYDENDQEIMGSLGNNLGAILSNARLMSQVSQQVEQQKLLFEITNKIRRATDIETILQTSTSEICRIVQARRAHIQISAEPSGNHHNGHKEVLS